jgi:hypothetical protein
MPPNLLPMCVDTVGACGQVIQKAQRAYDKAAKGEHKTAQTLGEARHKHDLAVAGENKAEHDISVREEELTTYQSCISPLAQPSLSSLLADLLHRCARSTSRRLIELLRGGVLSSSKLSAGKIPET